MAEFNPQISPLTENFKDYSRVVEAPHIASDTSTGTFLETIGKGIGGVAKIADDFMQQKVKNEATTGVDAIRDITTRALETATQPQNVVPQPAQTGDGTKVADPSLLDSNASVDVPDAIDGGLKRIGVLTNARMATSGRNDTLYVQQLNSLAKNLRAQYPGYRQYIDEQISSMTGMNPANAYVNSMLADLKASQTSVEKIWNETYRDVAGVDGHSVDGVTSQMMKDYLLQNRNNPAAISVANQFLYKAKADAATQAAQTGALTSRGQNDEQLKISARTLWETQTSDKTNNHFYAPQALNGVDPSKYSAILAAEAANPGSQNSVDLQNAVQVMAGQRDALIAELRYDASKKIIDKDTGKPAVDSRGNTYTMNSVLGKEAEEIIQRKAEQYNMVIKSAMDKDSGTVLYTANADTRAKADLNHRIMSDPANDALKKLKWLGDNTPAGVQGMVTTEFMGAGGPGILSNLFANKTVDMLVPSNIKNGKISTFRQDSTDARNGTNTGDATLAERERYATELVNNIKYLGNEPIGPKGVKLDDASQMRAADYYFNPSNRGVLQNFNQGYWRDSSGQPMPNSIWNYRVPGATFVPGREAVWDKLTNQKVTDNMARLAKLPGGQQTVTNYINWAQDEHSRMAVSAIKDLNEIQNAAPGSVGAVHLHYNADTSKFSLIDKNENLITLDPSKMKPVIAGDPKAVEFNYLSKMQASINRINEIGVNMLQIQDSLGNKQGMSAYYLGLLQREGFRPNENLKGMDQKFYDAIAVSHRVNRIEDVFKNELGNNK